MIKKILQGEYVLHFFYDGGFDMYYKLKKDYMLRGWKLLPTGVHVDWSRPVEYVKAHPHY